MKPQKGEHVFDVEIYSHTFNYSMTVELLAKFTYYPPYKGTWEEGYQTEPDEDEEYEITSIECNATKPTELELHVCRLFCSIDDYEPLIDEIKTKRIRK